MRSRRAPAVVFAVLCVGASVSGCSSSTSTDAGATVSSAAGGGTTLADGAKSPGSTRPVASPGCAVKANVATGAQVDVALTSSNVARTYKEYVPATAKATPNPLLIDLHGYQEGAAIHAVLSNLSALADTEGFILATPSGTGKIPFWNAVPQADGPQDLQFVSDVIDDVSAHRCIDPARVFVTGFSNGAFMSSLVACRLADKVAAIAPIAGLRFPAGCTPSRRMPVISFHGTADQFVSYTGGMGSKGAELPTDESSAHMFDGLSFDSIPDTVSKWAEVDGCAKTPDTSKVSASVSLVSYPGCQDGTAVELYTIEGGGHAWPNSAFSHSIENVVGPTTTEIDANALMWAFVVAHPMP